MIICHVITDLGYGGAEKLLINLANIQAKNNQVHIVYFKGIAELQHTLNNSIKLHHVNLDIYCAKNVRKLLVELLPDIVHTHLGHADVIGMWACRGLKAKCFCTMHNIWFKWDWRDSLIFGIYFILFKTIAKNCKVISISKAVAEHVEKVLKVSKHNSKMVYNAIPNTLNEYNKAMLRKEFNISDDSFCILFVGRLEIQKSVETLLYSVAELRSKINNIQVIIVGDGNLKLTLQELSKKLNIDNIVLFSGSILDVEKYYAMADVFVLPSVFEGFGIVILEAFKASLSVVSTNIEGPKELIEDGYNGFLFEPKDHHKLSDYLWRLYESSDERIRIGTNGYNSYKNNYNIKGYAEKIEALYTE